ncbi:MAG: MarR family winged helix-turn-helix transcriptional regulator [Pseudomonadales bacterium]
MSISSDLVTLNSAITQLMRTFRWVDEAQGVGRARLSALAVLHFSGSCSLSELARAEMVTRATMHHVVAGLEGDELIVRLPNREDARSQRIELTKLGRRVITAAHQARLDFLRSLIPGTSAAELANAAKVLSRLRDNARQEAL